MTRHRGIRPVFRHFYFAAFLEKETIFMHSAEKEKRPYRGAGKAKKKCGIRGRDTGERKTCSGIPSKSNKKGGIDIEKPNKERDSSKSCVLNLQGCSSSPRAISIAQLNTLLCLHLRPINLVVYKCPYSLEGMGYLILRCASRLDAFSVYHISTRLFCYALGRTTDAPEVRPTRSSRTKVSSSQISNAHDR